MPHTITIESGQKYVEDVLQAFGVPADDGRLTAEIIMDCELRGYADHGIHYLHSIVSLFYRLGMNPKPETTVIHEGPTMTLYDGDGGIGTIGATQAMERCIEQAAKYGIAMAGVQNSMMIVAGAPYVMPAIEAGVIGFVCSNIPGVAPPTGGLTRTFGTNPLAYGVPAGEHLPFIVDFATTATAAAKIMIAGRRGEDIEEGLVMHPDGRPMTDPKELDLASTLFLPMAGPKGYGLMMMVDILSGVLTGSGFGTDLNAGELLRTGDMKHSRMGNFMWVIDPAQFMPREEFLARMDRQIEQIKGGNRMEGVDEIFIPGERGLRQKAASLETGVIELEDSTWAMMTAAEEENGVSLPIPVG